MAVVYITEFSSMSNIGGASNIPVMPPLAEQTVAIGTEVDSVAFNASTRFIRVHNDAICSISIGAAPTASVTTMRLPANSVEYFKVPGGSKLSVITNT